MCLCLLAPVSGTDPSADYCAFVYGTAASLKKAGIGKTPVTEQLSAEIWCQAEHGGWHTKLVSALGHWLASVGHRDGVAAALERLEQGPEMPLREGIIWDVLEMLRGDGNWTH